MVIAGCAVALLPRAASRAVDRLGVEELRTVERHQQLAMHTAEVFQIPFIEEQPHAGLVDALQASGGNPVEYVADLVVAWYRLHSEEGSAVVVALVLLHRALEAEKRGALREEDAEGRLHHVAHARTEIATATIIGGQADGRCEEREQSAEDTCSLSHEGYREESTGSLFKCLVLSTTIFQSCSPSLPPPVAILRTAGAEV